MALEEAANGAIASGVLSPGEEEEAATKRSSVEALGKVLALFAASAYVVGFLTVNMYLFRLGVSEFSLFRPRFIYTGVLVLFSITLSFLAPVYGVKILAWRLPDPGGGVPKTRLERWALRTYPYVQKFISVARWINLFIFLLAPWLVFGLVMSLRGFGSPSSARWEALKLYFTSFVAGMIAVAIVEFIRATLKGSKDKPKDDRKGPGVWSASFAVFLFFLGYFGWYLGLYTKLIYPIIPEPFGGGEPKQVQFLLVRGDVEGAKQLGIPVQKQQSQLSEPLTLLFEGAQFYVLRLPEGHVVQVDKKIVTAVKILK